MMNGAYRRTCLCLMVTTLMVAAPGVTVGKKKHAADVSPAVLARHPEIQQLRAAVLASPDDPGLHIDLGNLYARQAWDTLALDEYHLAVDLAPTLHVAWANIGTIHSKAGNLDKAARAYRTAIDIQPLAATAHYNLGVVLDRMEDHDGALASYKTAVSLDPQLLDVAVNPQLVNNTQETAVRLLRYLDEVGSSSLSLEEVPGGDDADAADASVGAPADAPAEEAPAAEVDAGQDTASDPDSMTSRSVLGSLKMFTGRAERRLHQRADNLVGSGDEAALPGDAENAATSDHSTP